MMKLLPHLFHSICLKAYIDDARRNFKINFRPTCPHCALPLILISQVIQQIVFPQQQQPIAMN